MGACVWCMSTNMGCSYRYECIVSLWRAWKSWYGEYCILCWVWCMYVMIMMVMMFCKCDIYDMYICLWVYPCNYILYWRYYGSEYVYQWRCICDLVWFIDISGVSNRWECTCCVKLILYKNIFKDTDTFRGSHFD